MKLKDAKRIIFEGMKPRGYRVHFERVEGRILASDYFPERGEPLIEHEEEAWTLAMQFAAATVGNKVNIYVVDERWSPVPGYEKRKINNREPGAGPA